MTYVKLTKEHEQAIGQIKIIEQKLYDVRLYTTLFLSNSYGSDVSKLFNSMTHFLTFLNEIIESVDVTLQKINLECWDVMADI